MVKSEAPTLETKDGYRELEAYFKVGPGLTVDFAQFYIYLKELIRWGDKINLTAIRDPFEIVERHFLDSLYLLQFVSRGTVLDIGPGAGGANSRRPSSRRCA